MRRDLRVKRGVNILFCEGRKRGVQAEIVLHLFEYTSDGKVERSCLYRVQRESVGASSNTSSSSHFGLFRN